MKKIGIIGRGFVGTAVEFGFSAQTGCNAEIRAYDKNPSKSIHTLKKQSMSQILYFYLFQRRLIQMEVCI